MQSQRACAFIHASDFHLEQPPYGLADVPPDWRDRLLDCVHQGASRVFDAVLAHQADFLVLSGDILDWRAAGPRAVAFLLEQFHRLADAGINVYWAGSAIDAPDRWPTELTLPDNVHRFSPGHMDEFIVRRGGKPVARLVGTSRHRSRGARHGEWQLEVSPLFTIAVLHGTPSEESLKKRDIHYWALGGSHAAETVLPDEHRISRQPGTPQGRCPHEEGPHGCTLVEVDSDRRISLRPLETDVLRWHHETIALEPATDAEELELILHDRATSLVQAHPGLTWVIHWTIRSATGQGTSVLSSIGGVKQSPVMYQLRREGLDQRLLEGLRAQFGKPAPFEQDAQISAKTPLGQKATLGQKAGFGQKTALDQKVPLVPKATFGQVWSSGLDVEPSAAFPGAWYEQESFLGDFLRAVRHYQARPDERIDLGSALGDEPGEHLRQLTCLNDGATRQRVLQHVAQLGVDLLGGDLLGGKEAKA